MPISFTAAQERALNSLGGVERGGFETFVASNILEQYGAEFKALVEQYLKSRGVVSSGKLADTITSQVSTDGKKLTIKMLDYYDFPNEGVKGVRSSKNAAGSPYQFKNYGMSAEGRKSIKKYIQSGKALVSNVTYKKQGLERKFYKGKKKSLIDKQVDNLIYMIKRYGIKRTDYFNDAFETVFADFDEVIGQALGEDIKLSISLINSKKVK